MHLSPPSTLSFNLDRSRKVARYDGGMYIPETTLWRQGKAQGGSWSWDWVCLNFLRWEYQGLVRSVEYSNQRVLIEYSKSNVTPIRRRIDIRDVEGTSVRVPVVLSIIIINNTSTIRGPFWSVRIRVNVDFCCDTPYIMVVRVKCITVPLQSPQLTPWGFTSRSSFILVLSSCLSD